MSTSNKPPARYAHTNLVAKDWKAILKFYVEVFGCEPIGPERNHHGPNTDALMGVGGIRVRGQHLRLPGHGEQGPTLEIFSFDPDSQLQTMPLYHLGLAHLAFEVEDIARTRESVLARGGRDVGKLVTLDIAGAGQLSLIFMCDPEGNVIELQRWH